MSAAPPSFITSTSPRDIIQRVRASLLAKVGGTAFLMSALGQGTKVVMLTALARMLDLESYGIVIYVYTLATLAGMVAKFGLELTSIRFLSAYRASGNWLAYRRFRAWSFRAALFVASGVTVAWLLITNSLGSRTNSQLHISLLTAAGALIPIAIHGLGRGQLLSKKNPLKGNAGDTIIIPFGTILFAGAVFFFDRGKLSSIVVMRGYVMSVVAAAVCMQWWAWERLPIAQNAGSKWSAQHEGWSKVAMTLLFTEAMFAIHDQIDTVLVGALISTKAAGLYSAAVKIAHAPALIIAAVNSILGSFISELHTRKDLAGLQRLARQSALGIGAISLPAIVIMAIFGRFILRIFGQRFTEVYPCLLILLVAQTVNVLCGFAGAILNVTGNHHSTAKVVLATATLHVIGNLILIPKLGMIGAAIATASAVICWNIVLLYMAKRKLGVWAGVIPEGAFLRLLRASTSSSGS